MALKIIHIFRLHAVRLHLRGEPIHQVGTVLANPHWEIAGAGRKRDKSGLSGIMPPPSAPGGRAPRKSAASCNVTRVTLAPMVARPLIPPSYPRQISKSIKRAAAISLAATQGPGGSCVLIGNGFGLTIVNEIRDGGCRSVGLSFVTATDRHGPCLQPESRGARHHDDILQQSGVGRLLLGPISALRDRSIF